VHDGADGGSVSGSRSLVKNAADEEQVRESEVKSRNARDRDLDDVRAVLGLAAGRRFLLRLMKQCRTFESVWHASAEIHYRSGQQDVGFFVLGEIREADANEAFKIMTEGHKREEQSNG
jgi:hypothetical protein